MAEYIERDTALDCLRRYPSGERNGEKLYCAELRAAEDDIADLPAADVVEEVHAKWEHTHTSESYFNECWRCSACGFDDTEGFVFEFCPHCGAKMDLEESK